VLLFLITINSFTR